MIEVSLEELERSKKLGVKIRDEISYILKGEDAVVCLLALSAAVYNVLPCMGETEGVLRIMKSLLDRLQRDNGHDN